ncbi:ribbon-helix-helix domain-containing protein [Vulcanococcus sp.]|uniref:ribbon-helix-helix domain-containing protein n=1 Tax=Vulcanococcus sp. TaxID=2856995 RepID=UPI003F697A53
MAYANSANGIQRSLTNRAPKRLTITVPFSTFSALESRSVEQGRSLSNLAAYMLERGLAEGSSQS